MGPKSLTDLVSGTGTVTITNPGGRIRFGSFSLRVIVTDGTEQAQDEFMVTLSEQRQPAKPANLTAVPGDREVTLMWERVLTSGVTGYEYTTDGRASWQEISGSDASTTSHVVTGLTNGTSYTFQIRARNANPGLASDAVTATPLPVLSIADASVAEGAVGATPSLTFTATLSSMHSQPVTVAFAATDVSATAGEDYTETTGTLMFASGTTTQTISVPILGDALDEIDETFTMALSVPVNALVSTTAGTATGTITDDDDPPTVSIADASVAEGNSSETDMEFTVTLSEASGREVTVAYATADGTGANAATLADSDYTMTTGTLTFAKGDTSQTFTVEVSGDEAMESDETFTVTLSAPEGAALGEGEATGTITDDDTPAISITPIDDAIAFVSGLVVRVNFMATHADNKALQYKVEEIGELPRDQFRPFTDQRGAEIAHGSGEWNGHGDDN